LKQILPHFVGSARNNAKQLNYETTFNAFLGMGFIRPENELDTQEFEKLYNYMHTKMRVPH